MIANEYPYGKPRDFNARQMDEIARNIRQFGIQLIVVDTIADESYRPFVYTIGLRTRGQPELIAFAEDKDELGTIAHLFQRIAFKRQVVHAGDRLRDRRGVLVAAAPDAEFDALMQRHCLAEARSYYGVPRLDVLVILREKDLHLRPGLH